MNRREITIDKHLQEAEIAVRSRGKHLALFFICVMLLLGFASTQLLAPLTVGGAAGTVKDATWAVVKGTHIKLTHQTTQATQTTQSTSTWTYVSAMVPIGT